MELCEASDYAPNEWGHRCTKQKHNPRKEAHRCGCGHEWLDPTEAAPKPVRTVGGRLEL